MTQSPKIPKAREILTEALKGEMSNSVREAIHEALGLMHREKHKKQKSGVKSNPMTVELRDAIKDYCTVNPAESTSHIAQMFNVNQGRVSEVLSGKYDKPL